MLQTIERENTKSVLDDYGMKFSDEEYNAMNLSEMFEERNDVTLNPDIRERLLATTNAETMDYILVSCFTGAGTSSIHMKNDFKMTEPDMSECEALFPAGSEYAVDTLKANVDKYMVEAGN